MALPTSPTVPNHHAHHPGFSGLSGLAAGLGMAVGSTVDPDLVVRLAGLTAADRLVDLGCGPASAVRRAAGLGAHAIGIDPAPVMLRLARLRSARNRRIELRIGTAEEIPVADDDATVVWALATVHHWGDIDRAVGEVRRILRPGGRFVAVERRSEAGATGLASHGWTDEQAEAFAAACREHGLTEVRVERVQGGSGHRRRGGQRLAVIAREPG